MESAYSLVTRARTFLLCDKKEGLLRGEAKDRKCTRQRQETNEVANSGCNARTGAEHGRVEESAVDALHVYPCWVMVQVHLVCEKEAYLPW